VAVCELQARGVVAHLLRARLWVLFCGGSRCHDPAIDAVAALRDAFCDVRGLQWMRLFRRTKAGKRRDFLAGDSGDRQYARAHRLAVQLDGAGAALCEAAAEMRIVESEVI